jgi:hypothetical protein
MTYISGIIQFCSESAESISLSTATFCRTYLKSAMWLILPMALVCNAIVFSSDTLAALAFFHVNPALSFALYLFVLMSWFVMYFSSGLKLLNSQNSCSEVKLVPPLFEGVGLLNVLLNGFTLMGGIAAFMTFCERYGILSAAFLHGNLLFISGIFFVAGLIASYALTYQRIREVGVGIKKNTSDFNLHYLRITFAFIIAVFAGVSSGLFALYSTPLVALFHMVVPLQIAIARVTVTMLAFVAAFSLYFVSLNRQLEDLTAIFDKLIRGNTQSFTTRNKIFAIISLVAAAAFCLTSYHQFSVLFTITNANRGFIIAEVCCQWVAFATAYFDAYCSLAVELKKTPNVMFVAEHLTVAILMLYIMSAFVMPAIIPVIGYNSALLAGTLLFGLFMFVDHYIDRSSIPNAQESSEKPLLSSADNAEVKRVPMAAQVFGQENCEAVFKPIDGCIKNAVSCMHLVQSKVI